MITTILTTLPTDCVKPGCVVTPLSPDLVKPSSCAHVFHKICLEGYKIQYPIQQQSTGAQKTSKAVSTSKGFPCPSCTIPFENTIDVKKDSIKATEACDICYEKFKPDIVVLNCNHGLHLECFNAFYKEGSDLTKCPGHKENQHSINFDVRRMYTALEFEQLIKSKGPAPFKYLPPSPKKEEKAPATGENKRTWKSIGWNLTKGVIAATLAYKGARWFF
ncbi:MAG: hypothetical protein JSR58_00170 [Verrucomicrobia bacterium]|nr:hypothetical protein [Verrucomicrobiota bacterium]